MSVRRPTLSSIPATWARLKRTTMSQASISPPLACSRIVSALPTSAMERAPANIPWNSLRPMAGTPDRPPSGGERVAGGLGGAVAVAPLEPRGTVGVVAALLEPGAAARVVDELRARVHPVERVPGLRNLPDL